MKFKLNNRGWGLSDFLLIGSIIIIALLTSSVLIIRLTNGLKDNLRVNETNIKTNNKINQNNVKSETENTNNNESNTATSIDYKELENTLTNDAIKYIEEVYKNNIGENLFIVDYPHLLEVDTNLKNEMSKDNCNGYVEAKKNSGNIEITPYLKCDNYSTEGVKDYYLN